MLLALDYPGNAFDPSIAVNADSEPIVAWGERDGQSSNIYVQRFDGSDWVNVDTTPLDITLDNSSHSPSLVSVNDDLFVAWVEAGNIHVKRYFP
jgi:hypothetical protein